MEKDEMEKEKKLMKIMEFYLMENIRMEKDGMEKEENMIVMEN